MSSPQPPSPDEEEKKELEKFLKYFTQKCAQVVIESRLGEKVHTQSKVNSSTSDWFGLRIVDDEDILKKTLSGLEEQKKVESVVKERVPIVIEIGLKSLSVDPPEEPFCLEVWVIQFDEMEIEHVKVQYAFYNRLGNLLKSIISCTRSTNIYKLSRKINMKRLETCNVCNSKSHCEHQPASSDYVIYYNVYSERTTDFNNLLGNRYHLSLFAKVGSPYGTLKLQWGYRTVLEVTSSTNRQLLMKSDHYSNEDERRPDVELLERKAATPAFVVSSDTEQNLFEEVIPFSNLLKNSSTVRGRTSRNANNVQTSVVQEEAENADNKKSVDTVGEKSEESSDFILIDFKAPFATLDMTTDAMTLFTECNHAPPTLKSLPTPLSQNPDKNEKPNLLTEEEFNEFENNLKDFDLLVKNLKSMSNF